MGACIGALALSIAPGALRLAPGDGSLERAEPWNLGRVADGSSLPFTVGSGPPADEVPIIPPDDSLAGELAPAVAMPAPFRMSSGTRSGVLALVVGINNYPGSRSDLRSAVADADTVEAALAGFGVPADNVVVLRDGQARKAQLVEAIRSLVEIAGPDSTVVFAYAGHVRKLDRDTEAIVAADGGLLTDAELASLLAPSSAKRMWLLMASCYAGGFTEALAPGRILTGAADAHSLAYESQSVNGSYLVHHLVREGWLEGRAGRSVQEAFAYADVRIAQERSQGRPYQIDQAGSPLVLGAGDPAAGRAPRPSSGSQSAPPPQQAPPPTTTTTMPPKESCLAGLICRR